MARTRLTAETLVTETKKPVPAARTEQIASLLVGETAVTSKVASLIAGAYEGHQERLELVATRLFGRKLTSEESEAEALKATIVAEAILGSDAKEENVEAAADKILRASLLYPEVLSTTYNLLASTRPDFVALTKETPAGQKAPTPDIGTEESDDPASGGEESVHVHETRPTQAVLDVITNEKNPTKNIAASKDAMSRLVEGVRLLNSNVRLASNSLLSDSMSKVAAIVSNTKLAEKAKEVETAVKENKKPAAVKAMKELYAGLKTMVAGFDLMTEMDIDKTKPAGWINKQQTTAAKDEDDKSEADKDEEGEEGKDEDEPKNEDKEASKVTAEASPADEEEGSKEKTALNEGDVNNMEMGIQEDDGPEEGAGEGADEVSDGDSDDGMFERGDDGDPDDDDMDGNGDDDDDEALMDEDAPVGIDDAEGMGSGVDLALQDAAPVGGPNLGDGQQNADDEEFFGGAGAPPASVPAGPTAAKRSSQQLPRGMTRSASTSKGNELDSVFGGISDSDHAAMLKEFEN